MGFSGGRGKEPACQVVRHRRHGFNPWVRKIPGVGNGSSLQCSCLRKPMDGGARATVHGLQRSLDATEHTRAHNKASGCECFWHQTDLGSSHCQAVVNSLTLSRSLPLWVSLSSLYEIRMLYNTHFLGLMGASHERILGKCGA